MMFSLKSWCFKCLGFSLELSKVNCAGNQSSEIGKNNTESDLGAFLDDAAVTQRACP